MNDHARPLTIASPQRLTAAEWGAVADKALVKMRALTQVMEWIDTQRFQARACREATTRFPLALSWQRLKAWHLEWRRIDPATGRPWGEYAVIDHRLCGGCGLHLCDNQHRRSLLRQATVNHWVALLTQNKVHSGKASGKTQTAKQAWKTIIAQICSGETVPGLTSEAAPGTWRTLYMQVYATGEIPSVCPWSTATPPPGHSLPNYMARMPERAIIVAAQQGIGAARELTLEVRKDVSQYRPLEALQMDDKRLDVRICVMVDGKPQFVECWCLFAIDVATRRIVGFQMVPKITRADGTQRGISRRDMAHLSANILRLHGYPVAYQATWTGENASAAFTDELVDLIDRATCGQVRIKTSGTYAGEVTLGGGKEMGGNPQGKAYIEAFNRYIDIKIGRIAGQMGADYQRKSGNSDSLLRDAQRLAKSLGPLVDAETLGQLSGYHTEETILPLILEAIHEINNDPHHSLQGFDQITLWRYSLADDSWKPLHSPELTQMRAEIGDDAVNRFLAVDGRTQTRMETRQERWGRLYNPAHFRAIDPATYADLCMDAAKAKYEVAGRLLANFKPLSGRKIELEFRGQIAALAHGESYVVRFDFERLDMGCWVQNQRGQYLGTMRYAGRIDARDEVALQHAMGEQQQARAELLKRTRRVVQPRGKALGEVMRMSEGNKFISSIPVVAEMLEAEASESTQALMAARAESAAQKPRNASAPAVNLSELQSMILRANAARCDDAAEADDEPDDWRA
jgi:hypothetical protein